MAYTILNTDGTTLLILADNTVDTVATSLTLVGKNVSSYGEYINNNFVKLAANFASDSGSPPNTPLKGQLWYDTTTKRLKIYDNGFKNITGAISSSEIPSDLISGDLWFDTANAQLHVFSGNRTYVIGPGFPKSTGANGWNLPTIPVKDDDLNVKKVVLLQSYGDFVGLMSTATFTLAPTDALTYYNTTTSTLIVSGLNLEGDFRYGGKTNNDYYTVHIDFDHITPTYNDINDSIHFVYQTQAILNLLSGLYPINTTTNSIIGNPRNSISPEKGVLPGSQVRVVCKHTVPFSGYQIRRFIAKDIGRWDYYVISTAQITGTNVITILGAI